MGSRYRSDHFSRDQSIGSIRSESLIKEKSGEQIEKDKVGVNDELHIGTFATSGLSDQTKARWRPPPPTLASEKPFVKTQLNSLWSARLPHPRV